MLLRTKTNGIYGRETPYNGIKVMGSIVCIDFLIKASPIQTLWQHLILRRNYTLDSL